VFCLRLLFPSTERQDLGEFPAQLLCSMNSEVFQSDWQEQVLFLVLHEHRSLILASRYFSSAHVWTSALLNTHGSPLYHSWVLSLQLSHLWSSVLQN
jgi:hypothetical protein